MARFLLPLQDAPEVWSPEDVCFLVHPDSDAGDLEAKAVSLPPWLVRRRVRLGRNLDGEPLALFGSLNPVQREDALEAAEDWSERPPLLLPGDDVWAASSRAARLLADRCPDVFLDGKRLCFWNRNPVGKTELRVLLARATGDEAPSWLVENLVSGTVEFPGILKWTPDVLRAGRVRKQGG